MMTLSTNILYWHSLNCCLYLVSLVLMILDISDLNNFGWPSLKPSAFFSLHTLSITQNFLHILLFTLFSFLRSKFSFSWKEEVMHLKTAPGRYLIVVSNFPNSMFPRVLCNHTHHKCQLTLQHLKNNFHTIIMCCIIEVFHNW